MVLGLLSQGVCPIIKNIWTSTFALFSGGILAGWRWAC